MKDWKDMPDHTRVWIYQSDRKLNEEEVNVIREKGKVFVDQWTAHGANMDAVIEVFHNAFIIVFADEQKTQATGCSIDSSVHFIQNLEKQMNLDLFNRLRIVVEKDGELQWHHSANVPDLLEKKELNIEDTIYNNLVSTLGEFRTSWKVPIKSSWLAQSF